MNLPPKVVCPQFLALRMHWTLFSSLFPVAVCKLRYLALGSTQKVCAGWLFRYTFLVATSATAMADDALSFFFCLLLLSLLFNCAKFDHLDSTNSCFWFDRDTSACTARRPNIDLAWNYSFGRRKARTLLECTVRL